MDRIGHLDICMNRATLFRRLFRQGTQVIQLILRSVKARGSVIYALNKMPGDISNRISCTSWPVHLLVE